MRSADDLCLNCEASLGDDLYCPSCGQKTHRKDLSMSYLLSTFYIAFIDFDKKMLNSLRDIWIPNKISNDFLNGGRLKYINHLRFFLICLVIFFALLAYHIKQIDLDQSALTKEAYTNKVFSEIDSLERSSIYVCDTTFLEELKKRIFVEFIDTSSTEEAKNEAFEDMKKGWNSYEPDKETTNSDTIGGIITIHSNGGEQQFNTDDFFVLDEKAFIEKHEIEKGPYQFLTKQVLKIAKNIASAISFVIGNMFWAIIFTTVVMGIWLKLLYWRSQVFYAEHLMHVINFHIVITILIIILMAIDIFLDVKPVFYWLPILLGFIHLLVSLKKYHFQGWIKTILKGILILMAYLLIATIVLAISMLISVAIF